MTHIDELTKPPTQEAEGDITVSLSRAQAKALLKAVLYVWERAAPASDGVTPGPEWLAFAGGMYALEESINGR